MTTPRLQREFDRLYGKSPRVMTDRETEALFAGATPRRLPFAFYALLGGAAFGTLALYVVVFFQ